MNPDINLATAVILFCAVVLYEMLKTVAHAIAVKVFSSTFGSNTVTRYECLKCRRECQEKQKDAIRELTEEVSTVRQIMLVVAAKMGVGDEDLKRLAR